MGPVFTRPADLSDNDVGAALQRGWRLEPESLAYAPVGFGSHHWWADEPGHRWMVTVDDLEAKRRDRSEGRVDAGGRLAAALTIAHRLNRQGLSFVVAPRPTVGGALLEAIDARYVVALYPHIDGRTHGFGPYDSGRQRRAVIERLIPVHRAGADVRSAAMVDDLLIPRRRDLAEAMASPGPAWGPGPFAADAKRLLLRHRDSLADALNLYDRLSTEVAARPERFVVTHGEPHRANTIEADRGVMLIDWDTALLAPPERDLWMLFDEDPSIIDYYSERTGVDIDLDAIGLYRLWWDLCEVSLYVDEFRQPHIDSEDVRTAWQGLNQYLDPERWRDLTP